MGQFKLILKFILLGTVQGLCEFLPVSSSGHLVLLQRLLGFDLSGGGMTFVNLMLHLGTLIAVLIAFRKDIAALFKRPFKTLLMLLVATLPAGLCGLFFEKDIDALFAGERGIFYLALCFGATAVLLLACELVATRRKRAKPLSWGQTSVMGIVQAVAILPGISRSGSTIAAGTLAGADPGEASRFSFLLSIPVIAGGAILGIKDACSEPALLSGLGAAGICGVILGALVAAFAGYFAIKVMLKAMGKANYKWFALYLLLLATASLIMDTVGLL